MGAELTAAVTCFFFDWVLAWGFGCFYFGAVTILASAEVLVIEIIGFEGIEEELESEDVRSGLCYDV